MDHHARPLVAPPALSVDAITATVDQSLENLVAGLCGALNAYPRHAPPLPKRGYDHSAELVHCDTERRLCAVEYGHRFSKPNVFATGTAEWNAPATYDALMSQFSPCTKPSRLDVALDWEEADMFAYLDAILVAFALRGDLKLDQAGDWTRGAGRTRYVYSRQGRFFVRLYEYRAHHGYGPAVRLELEIKLKGDARSRLALTEPWRMLFMCPATFHVLKTVGLADGPALVVTAGARPIQSIDRDLRFLSTMAWPALARLIAHHVGDIEAALMHLIDYRAQTEAIRGDISHAGLAKPN